MGFLKANKRLSHKIERTLGFFPASEIVDELVPEGRVADVGGGKQPLFEKTPAIRHYCGIDLDAEELARAPAGTYDETIVADITRYRGNGDFDMLICRSTLEHVKDTEKAIKGLMSLLAPGGIGYLVVPSRNSVFSYINRLMPESAKRRLLFALYPAKQTDGFPAFYDRTTPHEVSAMIEAQGGTVDQVNKIYFSGYFTFFTPLHVLWRGAAMVQKATNPNYCERFEMIFRKDSAPQTR
ncbi:class I SAM-dependent methyltransferase [Citreimonas salinaria]|uniref:2-polyprenyl-6-hydroxyphenyl methylase / 3-demethylubiquinone-9 3-methyltransferase n=1 Tax=Citreimonas salinaria TaxID=321339 RepID=A0A1H3HTN9_9RHOB|nr:class I SAM-dependent methyltransferase [Citreimonas salinaria]SDY18891.1 2-polyprenyl-6-hydroxyphenyl methylase / 3-demethylubiquinone-9 3-methyltransferase [Citreimonas salinaria]